MVDGNITENIAEKLTAYINKELLDDINISSASLILQERVIDSINIAHLIDYIEKNFNVKLIQDVITIENFINVNAIAKLIIKLKDGNSNE